MALAEGLCDPCQRNGDGPPPPRVERFERTDGSFDVLAFCRHLDSQANVGAGAPR